MVNNLQQLREFYAEHELESIASALQILATHKLFELMVSQNKQVLLDSFETESPEILAGKIIEARQTNRILLSLRDLAQS